MFLDYWHLIDIDILDVVGLIPTLNIPCHFCLVELLDLGPPQLWGSPHQVSLTPASPRSPAALPQNHPVRVLTSLCFQPAVLQESWSQLWFSAFTVSPDLEEVILIVTSVLWWAQGKSLLFVFFFNFSLVVRTGLLRTLYVEQK